MDKVRNSRRARRSAGLLAVLALLFVIPWPTRIQASGMVRAKEVFPVHAPLHAQVLRLPATEGADIKAGQILIQFATAWQSRARSLRPRKHNW